MHPDLSPVYSETGDAETRNKKRYLQLFPSLRDLQEMQMQSQETITDYVTSRNEFPAPDDGEREGAALSIRDRRCICRSFRPLRPTDKLHRNVAVKNNLYAAREGSRGILSSKLFWTVSRICQITKYKDTYLSSLSAAVSAGALLQVLPETISRPSSETQCLPTPFELRIAPTCTSPLHPINREVRLHVHAFSLGIGPLHRNPRTRLKRPFFFFGTVSAVAEF